MMTDATMEDEARVPRGFGLVPLKQEGTIRVMIGGSDYQIDVPDTLSREDAIKMVTDEFLRATADKAHPWFSILRASHA